MAQKESVNWLGLSPSTVIFEMPSGFLYLLCSLKSSIFSISSNKANKIFVSKILIPTPFRYYYLMLSIGQVSESLFFLDVIGWAWIAFDANLDPLGVKIERW